MEQEEDVKREEVHKDHRKRMKEQFLAHGTDGFDDVRLLELLLFFSVPQVDVNPLSHRLLRQFKTLSGVFDAPLEELLRVEGVGQHTAILIKLLPQVARRYLISRESTHRVLTSAADAGAYLQPYFFGEPEEAVYLLGMDAKMKALGVRLVGRGTVDSVNANSRKVMEMALSLNAVHVILAHNHPSGNASPSQEDCLVTKQLYETLRSVGIALVDHLVVADGVVVSLRESGGMPYLRER